MDITTTQQIKKVFITCVVGIIIIFGIILLLFGESDKAIGFGCFLMLAGILLCYLLFGVFINTHGYQSIDFDEVDEFDL